MKQRHGFPIMVGVVALGLQACVSVALQGDHIVSNKNIQFKSGSAELDTRFFLLSPSTQILNGVQNVLHDHPEIHHLRIEGHTDAVGNAQQNQQLSTERAESVANWLRAHGVTIQLETVGFGSTHPLCQEATKSCYARNRRVEFAVVPDAPPPPPTPEPTPAPAADASGGAAGGTASGGASSGGGSASGSSGSSSSGSSGSSSGGRRTGGRRH